LSERPTIDKVRRKIGKGSPNTINPMLDAWWKTLSARLDSGPAALHRLPETVAHVAEALWMQALEEGRRRAHQELKTSEHLSHQLEQNLEVRSHVLSLREGELDSRLRDRERTIDDLNLRLRELTGILRKEQATRELLSRQTRKRSVEERLKGGPELRRGVRRKAPNNADLQSVRVPKRKAPEAARLATRTKKSKQKRNSAKRATSRGSKATKRR
jgi:plasmid replication DNA-binding protein KfrA